MVIIAVLLCCLTSTTPVFAAPDPPDDIDRRFFSERVRQGFVYERVLHIQQSDIARNAEIDVIWEKLQPAVEQALADLNTALRGHKTPFDVDTGGRAGKAVDFGAPAGKTVKLPSGEDAPASALLEWEVPREAPEDWPAAAREPLEAFWQARITRQKEIDASIAAKAEFEYLYDKPYEDKRRSAWPVHSPLKVCRRTVCSTLARTTS